MADVERGIQNGTGQQDHAPNSQIPLAQRKPYDYGGNPLARTDTTDTTPVRAFGGAFQPGAYKINRKFANPAPLGLSAFALTTFVLSLINVHARGVTEPNIVVALAFGYGGLVQLLAGMWEMAVGNTFGATALSSYGGFWISFAIIFTPGGFNIIDGGYKGLTPEFANAFGFYLFGWFIFTFVLLIGTLRSTIAFFFLFFTLDLAFLFLAIGWIDHDVTMGTDSTGAPALLASANVPLNKAGGWFGLLAAFAAWYNALAGILDRSNSFFLTPVAHFPWSDTALKRKGLPTKEEEHQQTNFPEKND